MGFDDYRFAVARSREHVVETESRRIVAATLPAERFVEREQTERDYGIDMAIEHFADGEPSGRLLLLQLKGTDGAPPPPEQVTIPFDAQVKALLRCERFATPILLVWVPVQDEARRSWFLWLQSYLRIVLDQESPGWRTQTTVRLHVPIANVLGDAANEGKLVHIAGEPARAAAFGQLSRLAHDARWAARDPATLAAVFSEALALAPIFGDPTWRWGLDQRQMIERGLLACELASRDDNPSGDDLRAIGWQGGRAATDDEEHRRELLLVGAQNCAHLMSTMVANYFDDRQRHTVWKAVGDHDF